MTIKPPIIPKDESEPGEIPLVIPEAYDPDTGDGLTPINVAPNLNGNAPPSWRVKPQAIKTPSGVYAMLPTAWSYNIEMGGVPLILNSTYTEWIHAEPQYYYGTPGLFEYVRSDGTHGTYRSKPRLEFSGQFNGSDEWEFVNSPPTGFTLPPAPSAPNQYELISLYDWQPLIVQWSYWYELAKPECLPDIMWSTDIYMLIQCQFYYGLFRYTPRNRRAACLASMFSLFTLFSVLFSGANPPQLQHSNQRRRHVKDSLI